MPEDSAGRTKLIFINSVEMGMHMIVNFWNNLSFSVKTIGLVVVLASFTAITGVRYHLLVQKITDSSVDQSTDIMLTGYKSELKDVVDMMAVTLASAVKGIDDEKQIYQKFKTLVQDARFFPDKSGYIFIYKKGGTVFVLPPQPEKEGKNLIDFKDPNGKLLIKELDTVAQAGGGFVDYMWEKPKKGLQPKLSYARMMPGNQFWIGTGVYIDDIQEQKEKILTTTKQLTSDFLETLYLVLGTAVLFLLMPMTWLLIRSIVKPVRDLTDFADQFSRGKIDIVIPYTTRKDEIGKLANALNRLGMSIKVAITRLKK
ncbi:MAG: cache domain-containing protein [Desulforhopalus sp.]|nr:cache domain-containing protein [Desulforhopalus sp.]